MDATNERESAQATKDRNAHALAERLRGNAAFEQLARKLNRERVFGAIAHVKNPQERAVQRIMFAWNLGSRLEPDVYHMMHAAIEHEFGVTGHQANEPPSRAWAKYTDGFRAFARAQYDYTQSWLSANKVASATLWRGMTWDDEQPPPHGGVWDNRVHDATVSLRPVASLTSDLHQAMRFASPSTAPRNYMQLSAMRVPASRIIATGQTGLGEKHESEFLVLGGRWKARVRGAETTSMAQGDATTDAWRSAQTYIDFASGG